MPKKRRRPRTLPVRIEPREGGGIALLVGGVTQSISQAEDDGYWRLMLPDACPRRALLLGLGGGAVATLLARRCPDVALVGVERDAAVLALAPEAFGLADLPQLTIVKADAFAWVEAYDGEPFDLICVDLFEAGRLVAGALATPFLRRLAAMLSADGVVTFNLMETGRTPEQLHRLRRVFAIEREQRLHGNVVLHLRPLPAPEQQEAPPQPK